MMILPMVLLANDFTAFHAVLTTLPAILAAPLNTFFLKSTILLNSPMSPSQV